MRTGKADRLTDWLQRPLTERQLSYAAADVAHLLAAARRARGPARRAGPDGVGRGGLRGAAHRAPRAPRPRRGLAPDQGGPPPQGLRARDRPGRRRLARASGRRSWTRHPASCCRTWAWCPWPPRRPPPSTSCGRSAAWTAGSSRAAGARSCWRSWRDSKGPDPRGRSERPTAGAGLRAPAGGPADLRLGHPAGPGPGAGDLAAGDPQRPRGPAAGRPRRPADHGVARRDRRASRSAAWWRARPRWPSSRAGGWCWRIAATAEPGARAVTRLSSEPASGHHQHHRRRRARTGGHRGGTTARPATRPGPAGWRRAADHPHRGRPGPRRRRASQGDHGSADSAGDRHAATARSAASAGDSGPAVGSTGCAALTATVRSRRPRRRAARIPVTAPGTAWPAVASAPRPRQAAEQGTERRPPHRAPPPADPGPRTRGSRRGGDPHGEGGGGSGDLHRDPHDLAHRRGLQEATADARPARDHPGHHRTRPGPGDRVGPGTGRIGRRGGTGRRAFPATHPGESSTNADSGRLRTPRGRGWPPPPRAPRPEDPGQPLLGHRGRDRAPPTVAVTEATDSTVSPSRWCTRPSSSWRTDAASGRGRDAQQAQRRGVEDVHPEQHQQRARAGWRRRSPRRNRRMPSQPEGGERQQRGHRRPADARPRADLLSDSTMRASSGPRAPLSGRGVPARGVGREPSEPAMPCRRAPARRPPRRAPTRVGEVDRDLDAPRGPPAPRRAAPVSQDAVGGVEQLEVAAAQHRRGRGAAAAAAGSAPASTTGSPRLGLDAVGSRRRAGTAARLAGPSRGRRRRSRGSGRGTRPGRRGRRPARGAPRRPRRPSSSPW